MAPRNIRKRTLDDEEDVCEEDQASAAEEARLLAERLEEARYHIKMRERAKVCATYKSERLKQSTPSFIVLLASPRASS